MSYDRSSGEGPVKSDLGFYGDTDLEVQETMASQTPNLQPSSLMRIAPFDSGMSVQIRTQSQPPKILPQPTHLPDAPNTPQPNSFVSEAMSDQYCVPSQSLAITAGTPEKETKKRALVSCHLCRSAKIRCDRGQPICQNCTERRAVCTYEESIRRRGPDKKPGTRSRRPAQSGGEKQARVHPYRATGLKMDTVKPGHKAKEIPRASNSLVYGTNGSEIFLPLRNAIKSPPRSAPPLTILPPLSRPMPHHHSTAPSIHTTLQFQHYDPHIHKKVILLKIAPHQTQSADGPALPAVPAPQLVATSISIGKPEDRTSSDRLESTEYEATSESPGDDTSIGKEPSLRFSQDTWWDTVLTIYDPSSKRRAAQLATADLHAFLQTSSAWSYFLNIPLFFNMFYHPEHRAMMQPALVLGCLAYSAHTQGSEREGGERQRQKALRLRDFGQAAFDASYNAGWIDIPLAQASWILALFELCVHPEATMARMGSSLSVMDNVISILGLTSLDGESPRPPTVFTGMVPIVGRRGYEGSEPDTHLVTPSPSLDPGKCTKHNVKSLPMQLQSDHEGTHRTSSASTSHHCPCSELSMQNKSDPLRSTPMWMMAPKWDQEAPFGVLRREEARRLVWSALRLVAGEINRRLSTGTPLLDLELVKLTNFAILYPGEELYHRNDAIDAAYSSKESTWALHSRAVHLWVACTTHHDVALTPHDKADLATKTWMETIVIEDALNSHHCDGERAAMYQTRENLFNIRMFISDQYRSFIPIPQSDVNFSHFDRRRAVEWLEHQNSDILDLRTAMSDLNSYPAKVLVQRSFLVWWQTVQIWRALALFDMDNSLTLAVDVILNVLPVFMFLQEMWPSPEHRRLCRPLMNRVRNACLKTGKSLPSLDFSF